MNRWLSWLRARLRSNDGFRFHVWNHTKDRRTQDQVARYLAIQDQRRGMLWSGMFDRCDQDHDAHVRAYQINLAQKFVSANVVPFRRVAR